MEKIWLQSYPEDVPAEVDLNRYQSLLQILDESISKHATNTAFISMGKSISFQQLNDYADAFAAYLQQVLGMKKGDALAIMMPNLMQYPVAIIGAFRAGCVVVNVNPLYTPRELQHQLNDSGSKTIIILENFADTLQKVLPDTKVEHIITAKMGDLLGGFKGTLVNFVVKNIKKLVPEFSLPAAIPFTQVMKKGAGLTYTKPQLVPEDIAFLQYTGGTTGVSKGAMLTHYCMISNSEQVMANLNPILEEGNELVVTPLPLYHIFALMANFLTFIRFGSPNLLIANPRDLPGFVKELNKYSFTIITGVNTLFNGLLNTQGFEELDFSKLKLSLGGGMAVQRPVAERWQQVTHTGLIEGYGLTECSPVVTLCPYNIKEYTGSIGIPAPSTEIRIIQDDGSEAAIGDPGELWVKGPQLMLGYLNRPEATAEVIKDGWFATGDIAKIDEKGFLYIVDRKKDMILVSGFNVFPNEIEEIVAMHEKVLECAAIGIPHEASGEIVKIFVVKKDSSLTEEEIIKHCREYLTGYKVPKQVEFREDLPKTNVGKILRRELRP